MDGGTEIRRCIDRHGDKNKINQINKSVIWYVEETLFRLEIL